MNANSRRRLRFLPIVIVVLVALDAMLLSTAAAQSASDSQVETTTRQIEGEDGERVAVMRDKEVIIGKGDTFMSLSRREFDTVGLWRLIAEYNNLDVKKPLFNGQKINIPRYYYRPLEFAEVIYAHGENQFLPGDGSEQRDLTREDKIYLNDTVET